MDLESAKEIASKAGRIAGKTALFLGKAAFVVGTGVCKELLKRGAAINEEKSSLSTKTDSELLSDFKGSDNTRKAAIYSSLKERGYSSEEIKDKLSNS